MLNREELREITTIEGKNGYFVSLYLNVDPIFNKRGDYAVHFKNMMKNTVETLDKTVYKTVKDDLEKIDDILVSGNESYTGGEIRRRLFEAGFVVVKASIVVKAPGSFPSRLSCDVCGCEAAPLVEYTKW